MSLPVRWAEGACLKSVHSVFSPQLESLLHLWLTLSLNSYSCGAEDSGGDIFLFNSGRVPTIPINQGQRSFRASSALLASLLSCVFESPCVCVQRPSAASSQCCHGTPTRP